MKVLIVVDYQKDFIDGILGFPGAEKIEPEIIKLIEEFKSRKERIFLTMDTHLEETYKDTSEFRHLPPIHCVRGSDGWKISKNILEAVEDYPNHLIVEKPGFPSLDLANMLREKENIEEIHLCGLVSDICVFSNALMAKAACPNAEIYIHKNASDSYDHDMEKKTYEVATHLHINIVD